mgnify:CR=1 FL=1
MSGALPLSYRASKSTRNALGGPDRIRTCDRQTVVGFLDALLTLPMSGETRSSDSHSNNNDNAGLKLQFFSGDISRVKRSLPNFALTTMVSLARMRACLISTSSSSMSLMASDFCTAVTAPVLAPAPLACGSLRAVLPHALRSLPCSCTTPWSVQSSSRSRRWGLTTRSTGAARRPGYLCVRPSILLRSAPPSARATAAARAGRWRPRLCSLRGQS